MLSVFRLKSRRVRLRTVAFVMAPLMVLGIVGANQAFAAPWGVSASITAPQCGSDASVTINSTRSSKVKFTINRSDPAGVWHEVALYSPRTTKLSVPLTSAQTISVSVEGTTIATKLVAPSANSCGSTTAALPPLGASFTANINAPSCGNEATVVFNNSMNSVVWYEVWRQGASGPDVVTAVGAKSVASVTDAVTAANTTVKVIWNGKTFAQKAITPQKPCATTTTTAGVTTTTKPSTTTTSTTTPSTTSTSTTSTSTSTSTSTTSTTAMPRCTTKFNLSYWGCPVRGDDFNGTVLSNASTGWNKYDIPNGNQPRMPQNVRVAGGELQLVGTYDRATDYTMGAAIADHYNQMYGRWEVRMRADRGAGYSAVSLLWPDSENWPTDGELDIFEIPKAERARAMSVAHNGPTNKSLGQWTELDATQWHDYAVEWLPGSVTFFIDGKQVLRTTNPALIPSGSPMHLTLQFDAHRRADGCSGWYQCTDANTGPETVMHVDSVRVWKMPS